MYDMTRIYKIILLYTINYHMYDLYNQTTNSCLDQNLLVDHGIAQENHAQVIPKC